MRLVCMEMVRSYVLQIAKKWIICLMGLLVVNSAWALKLPLPSYGDIVGHVGYAYAESNDSLADLGQRYGMGYYEMVEANPKINAGRRLYRGKKVVIPGSFILPSGPRRGIVINLAELRLYYYPPNSNMVVTFPIGIGREDEWATPEGKTTVVKKEKDPIWRPTDNVRKEAARQGYNIPKVFLPGPDNPLGKYALRLGWPTYLIHGTNQPRFIGSRVSAGCIRMLPKDIRYLYYNIPVGTEVRVVNEPFKVGWMHGKMYFEAHPPLKENEHLYDRNMSQVVAFVHYQALKKGSYVKWSKVKREVKKTSGIPILIN